MQKRLGTNARQGLNASLLAQSKSASALPISIHSDDPDDPKRSPNKQWTEIRKKGFIATQTVSQSLDYKPTGKSPPKVVNKTLVVKLANPGRSIESKRKAQKESHREKLRK